MKAVKFGFIKDLLFVFGLQKKIKALLRQIFVCQTKLDKKIERLHSLF